jgi:hypothetical protein
MLAYLPTLIGLFLTQLLSLVCYWLLPRVLRGLANIGIKDMPRPVMVALDGRTLPLSAVLLSGIFIGSLLTGGTRTILGTVLFCAGFISIILFAVFWAAIIAFIINMAQSAQHYMHMHQMMSEWRGGAEEHPYPDFPEERDFDEEGTDWGDFGDEEE